LTFAEVAERIGADEGMIRRAWRAFGLAEWSSDAGVASVAEAEAFRVVATSVALLGEDLTLDLARSIGAGLARIGEAQNSIGRSLSPSSSLATSGSELETARYWAAVAPVAAQMGPLLDVLSRHHFELAREHFERSESFDLMHRRLTRGAVGFIDMSGYPEATEQLGDVEFSRLISAFSTQVGETVSELSGRVVKLVGDAAMVVAPNPAMLATIAHELVVGWAAVGAGLTLHGGLASGELLCQDGDYFGSAVNLAARLSALAEPGTIVASASVGTALPADEWAVEWLDPRPVRGLAAPVVTCLVRPARQ
jgi:adenylate cyclase